MGHVKLFVLTTITMVAFAANSLLNRLALADGEIGPGGFAAIRVAAGVLVLVVLLMARDRRFPRPTKPNVPAVAGLALYMLGFSFAYVSMDAGIGALVLFGGVQITMFFGALVAGERPAPQRWVGMAFAMIGLAVLTVPSGPIVIDPGALFLMILAALGWGLYSLIGRRVSDPLSATGWNFLYCLPLVLVVLVLLPDDTASSWRGIALAMVSGGVTSALGYALWYSLLPSLEVTKAALAQLSAPAIALFLGVLLLGETVTLAAILAAIMILGGIAVGVVPRRRPN